LNYARTRTDYITIVLTWQAEMIKYDMVKICDAVFEGGGMRGIGFVGAVRKFEEAGYRFRNVAGSSAGAIVASLIAAGYTAEEMHREMASVQFDKFKHSAYWGGLGPFGAALGAAKNFGLYSAKLFESWLGDLLARKGVYTFNDVGGRLKLTASDITDQKGLLLPNDLKKFGIDPGGFSVATAVRMSMGIPVFYEPYELVDTEGAVHYIVDGGMLSNYPIWILDDGTKWLDVPVFGFRFTRHPGHRRTKKPSLITYVKQIVTTIVEAHDDEFQAVVRGDLQRTIYIDTLVDGAKIGITDFNMKPETIQGMYENGVRAGTEFLKTWDFKKWNKDYRY